MRCGQVKRLPGALIFCCTFVKIGRMGSFILAGIGTTTVKQRCRTGRATCHAVSAHVRSNPTIVALILSLQQKINAPDRAVFRGHLLALSFVLGMTRYLQRIGCLLKDFGAHAEAKTEQLIEQSIQRAVKLNRPVKYIESPSLRKEDFVRTIAQADKITEGLIAVLTCVGNCLF